MSTPVRNIFRVSHPQRRNYKSLIPHITIEHYNHAAGIDNTHTHTRGASIKQRTKRILCKCLREPKNENLTIFMNASLAGVRIWSMNIFYKAYWLCTCFVGRQLQYDSPMYALSDRYSLCVWYVVDWPWLLSPCPSPPQGHTHTVLSLAARPWATDCRCSVAYPPLLHPGYTYLCSGFYWFCWCSNETCVVSVSIIWCRHDH